MDDFESKGWTTVQDGMVQCEYQNKGGERFIVRRYGEYEWMAISLSVKRFGVGQIIEKGQSDIDCYNKSIKVIQKEREKGEKS